MTLVEVEETVVVDDITVLAIVPVADVLVFVVTAVVMLVVVLITNGDEAFVFVDVIVAADVDVSSINTVD